MLEREGRNVDRKGVSGLSSRKSDARILGSAGVGSVGEAMPDSIISTSLASMLSMLSPSVNMMGVSEDDVELADGVRLGEGLLF